MRNRTIRVDVPIVPATNRNLKQLVDEGKFRSDLYCRLHVTQKRARRMNRPIEGIPSASIEALTRRDRPGNIREL